ncbi:MAG TPA: type II toxin-antitoxin system Phd/YefM family antitoxin [Gammaproteobacteria bacterium]|nr:type II toxin-antitoxin system Phd/YefM family antitoxin [Gammaproteobacteria bacterium]
MLRKAPAMTVRQNLGELLNEVQYRHDSILITKADKPVAALVDIDLFNRIRLLQKEFDHLTDELATTYANVDADKAQAEIDEAIDVARHS